MSIIRIRDDYDPYFILYYLRSHLGQIQFQKWFSGSSGQIEIQPSDLCDFIIPIAREGGVNIEKQSRIAGLITDQLNLVSDLRNQATQKYNVALEHFESQILTMPLG